MLKVIQVSSPAAKKNYLNQIDISSQSWIVSDLQSREEVQIALGQKYGRYEAHSVLRASELWAELLKRQFPHYRLVGNHLSRMMIGQFLEEYQQFLVQFDRLGKITPSHGNLTELYVTVDAHPLSRSGTRTDLRLV